MYLVNGGINTLHSYEIFLYDDIEKRKSKVPADHQTFSNLCCLIMKKGYIYLFTQV